MSIKYSANFKKDYITAIVVILFIFTFVSEVFLAFYMPLKLRDSSLWDKEASLQQLIAKIDGVRGQYRRLKSKNIIIQSQASLGADFMAEITEYIRSYRNILSLDNIHKINLMVSRFEADIANFSKDKSYGEDLNVNTKAYTKRKVSELKKTGMKLNAQAKKDNK